MLVTDLRDLLGAKLVAYLGDVKEARAGRRHRQVAGEHDLLRLRLAYKAARPFHPRRQPAVIQASFQARTPRWPTGPPAQLLRFDVVDHGGLERALIHHIK